MPAKGRSKYWEKRYEALRKDGYSEANAAATASIIERRHKAKLKRKKNKSR
jgi:hypothetical protein